MNQIFITLLEGNGYTETHQRKLDFEISRLHPEFDVDVELMRRTSGFAHLPRIIQDAEFGDDEYLDRDFLVEEIKRIVERM